MVREYNGKDMREYESEHVVVTVPRKDEKGTKMFYGHYWASASKKPSNIIEIERRGECQ